MTKAMRERIRRDFKPKPCGVYGIPTGGSVVAAHLAGMLRVPVLDAPVHNGIVVDDLIDSGRTITPFIAKGYYCDALLVKRGTPKPLQGNRPVFDGWVVFPWEKKTGAEDSVVRLLEYIGEDPNREGLKETPDRVLRAWKELTVGYQQDPKEILSKRFTAKYDQMVVVRGIRFTSICEHHLLPFTGTVTVGYIPNDQVVGLSKLARLVLCFAHRLQIQEQMTTQIAEAIQKELNPAGVGVIITAKHSCMGCRGVKQPDADMVTSAMLGDLRVNDAARAEFMGL